MLSFASPIHFLRVHRWISAGIVGAALTNLDQIVGGSLLEIGLSGALAFLGTLLSLTPPVAPKSIEGVAWDDYTIAIQRTQAAATQLAAIANGRLAASLDPIVHDLIAMTHEFEKDPGDAARTYAFTSATLPRLVAVAQQAHALGIASDEGRLDADGQAVLDTSLKGLDEAKKAVALTLSGLLSDDLVRLRTAAASLTAVLAAQGLPTST
jgi:hypothetical protein